MTSVELTTCAHLNIRCLCVLHCYYVYFTQVMNDVTFMKQNIYVAVVKVVFYFLEL